MSKKIIAIILTIAVLFQISGIAYSAALTDPDDLSKGIKLGLDLATATAEDKDSIAAAKKVAQKEFDDWTWKYVVGNYEKLITQNADAELPDFKEKIGKLQEFIERVGQVATQLGEGKYDEALFTSVDQAVATFDHPVVTVLWASVKLTYESHKLVQETKAALQIEALYGKVNNDRLLLGASSPDSPKQIQVNSETVDRFFFNYLIKDEGTRELMKPYVKITLGQEWPELSTTDWLKSFTLLGTGLDAQKDYEVEQLTQFRNVSRQWITALLNDINKQAKVDWAATRARQQKAEFDAYASRMKGFSAEQIIESFMKRKAMLKAKKDYQKFLVDSPAAYQKLSSEVGKLKPTQVLRMQEIYSSAVSNKGTAENYSKMALMIDDLPLCNDLEKESINWGKLANDILKTIRENQQKVDDAVVQDAAASSSYSATELSQCYGQFSGALPNFSFKESPDSAYEKVRSLLNEGELQGATDIINTWNGNEQANAAKTYHDSLTALRKAVDSAPKYDGGYGGSAYITFFTEDYGRWYNSREPGYMWGPYGSLIKYECAHSSTVADQAGWVSFLSFRTQIGNEAGRMNELIGAFSSLAQQRAAELSALRAALSNIYSKLDVSLAYGDKKPMLEYIDRKPGEIVEVEEAQKYLKDNIYTYLGNLNEKGYGLVSIDGYMEQKAGEIKSIADNLDAYITYLENKYPGVVKKWQEGLNDWQKLEKPDDETVNQFLVLVDDHFNKDREVLSMDNRAGVIKTYAGQLPAIVKSFTASAQTEIFNRSQDADYLRTMVAQWRAWLNLQIENGTFERNYPPTGVPIPKDKDNFDGDLRIKPSSDSYMDFTSGMLIMYKPYFHFATDKEIKTLPQPQKARQDLQKFKVYSFINSNMPAYAAKLESLFSGSNIIPAKEDNFFVQNNKSFVIYRSDIGRAEELVNRLDPEKDDFISKLKEISLLLPGTIIAQTPDDVKAALEKKGGKYFGKFYEFSEMTDIDRSQYAGFEMGKTYLGLVEKISALIDKRRDLIYKKAQKDADEQSKAERLKYFTDEINKMNNEIDALPDSSINENTSNVLYSNYFQLYNSYLSQKLTGLDAPFKALEDKILSLRNRFEGMQNQKIQQVKDLYASFKQAYESKDVFNVMSFISDDWEAGDGTTLSDLQNYLNNSFNVFNEIRYDISNIQINKISDNRYEANYEVSIFGRIYESGIKHEEKSSVREEVIIDASGRIKISRTLNGRFWYIE